ncbi:MAG: MATE family efflux transporter [Lachnospiraceae bacterium]|nr:MATE family efflux transporter [Lachnospiraceae bacterium]
MTTTLVETNNREEALRVKLSLRECLFGDKAFYGKVATVVIPMIIQNTLSNIVGLLDNVMVGRVGQLPMSAVAIVNQILFIFYLCIWGSLAGSGIYGTQFFGKGDMEGVRATIRFKMMTTVVIVSAWIMILLSFGKHFIALYISEDTTAADAAKTMEYAASYLAVMVIGLVPFAITQIFGSAMRESGKTKLPMIAGMTAMVVNFVFNLLLIFGLLGFPKLGVLGAAIATVISRFVEMSIVLIGAYTSEKYRFFHGLFSPFVVPRQMIWPLLSKCLPLLANEFFWSMAQAALLQAYSTRNLAVVAAMNISGTISQIFNEVFLSLGNSTGIIVGQELGAGRLVNARRSAWRMINTSFLSTLVMGSLLATVAPLIPQIYDVEPDVKVLATRCIWMVALCMPIHSFANASYFTLRSGGKILITILFDSCFSWVVSVPTAYILCKYTNIYIVTVYGIVMGVEILKCILGFILIRNGVWVRNIVGEEE